MRLPQIVFLLLLFSISIFSCRETLSEQHSKTQKENEAPNIEKNEREASPKKIEVKKPKISPPSIDSKERNTRAQDSLKPVIAKA